MFKSSGSRADDRRAVFTQRGGRLGAPLLRAAGVDRIPTDRGQPASLSDRDSSPGRADPGRQSGRNPAGTDPNGSRHPPRRQTADEARLGATLTLVAQRAGRSDHDARGDSRTADDLHRLRLPVVEDVRAAEPGRRGRRSRARRALLRQPTPASRNARCSWSISRAITSRWISFVPSYSCVILASRIMRSTGYSLM